VVVDPLVRFSKEKWIKNIQVYEAHSFLKHEMMKSIHLLKTYASTISPMLGLAEVSRQTLTLLLVPRWEAVF